MDPQKLQSSKNLQEPCSIVVWI